MGYLGLICARGGSKGIRNKNIALFNKKPLIYWTIKLGLKISSISNLIVSSDSDKIINISKKYGAEVLFKRPKNLSLSSSPEWKVWQHAINYIEQNKEKKYKGLIVLPPTSPLRNIQDINKSIKLFENKDSDVVIAVRKAERNPYFNMVERDNKGFLNISKKLKTNIFRRQDAPIVFDMTTTIFVININFLKKNKNIFQGKIRYIEVPYERSIDIDTPQDLFIAEKLLKFKKND
tara:strand:- start:1957 stop:2658 length:702 start_codon:yes stop_codon:yes gene_type:complete